MTMISEIVGDYLACVVWTDAGDQLAGDWEWSAKALAEAGAFCEWFVNTANPADLDLWVELFGAGQIGHDLWLSRNGHGTGFWDRGDHHPDAAGWRVAVTEAGDRLHAIVRHKDRWVYLGDDGKAHFG